MHTVFGSRAPALVASSLALLALLGCSNGHGGDGGTSTGGGDGGGDGGPGRDAGPNCAVVACAQPCTSTVSCPTNLVCTNGYCAPPTPTSTNYAPCELDADCPLGEHCALGVCGYDCLTDRDCLNSLLCDSRGRCNPPQDAGTPQPAASPTAITFSASPSLLDLGLSSSSATVTIATSGSEALPFQTLSSKPWLTITPSSGTLTSGSQPLTLNVDRSLAQNVDGGMDTQASVRINTSAGTSIVLVQIGGSVTGQWTGSVSLSVGASADAGGGYPLAISSLQMDLTEGAGGQITGYVEPASSLLFPFQSTVTGTLSGDSISLSFSVPTTPGSAQNPAGTLWYMRDVTLTGTLGGSGTITGSYLEQWDGTEGYGSSTPLQSVAAGPFTLRNAGPPLPGQGSALPTLPRWPSDPTQVSPGPYDACAAEQPNNPDWPTEYAQGGADLLAAAPFYAYFGTAVGKAPSTQLNGSAGDPYVATVGGNCGGSCLDAVKLRCAEYWFWSALGSAAEFQQVDGGYSSAEYDQSFDGLLDAWQVGADYALLFGNDQLVQAAGAWQTSNQLSSALLATPTNALAYLSAGSHTQDQTQPVAMLDPFWQTFYVNPFNFLNLQVVPDLMSGTTTAVGNGAATPNTHLQSQLQTIAGHLQAADNLSNWQFRLQDAADVQDAQSTISLAAVQDYLDLAWLSQLMTTTSLNQIGVPALGSIASSFQSLAKRFSDITQGRNPSGFVADYVFLDPASANQAGGQGDNFQQIYNFITSSNGPLAVATQDFATALGAMQSYDMGSGSYTSEVDSLTSQYANQIAAICGYTSNAIPAGLAGCGVTGGTLFDATGDAQNALGSMQQAQNNITNLAAEVQIEQQRAQQVSGIYDAQAELITSQGQMIQAIDQTKLVADTAAAVIGAIGSAITGAFTGNPGALLSGASSAISGIAADEAQNAKDQLATVQGAQVQYNSANIELINSAATIDDDLLQQANLQIQLSVATENLTQAIAKVNDLYAQAQLLASEDAQYSQQATFTAQNLLRSRIYANDTALLAEQTLDNLLAWTFLATRALEYQLNVSLQPGGSPDPTSLWSYLSPIELNTKYLSVLNSYYVGNRTSSVQTNVDVISVRDQLLDMSHSVTDAVTGHIYTPQERFQRYVADPAHHDQNNNLAIPFFTYRPNAPIFSSDVCNDMIDTIQGNLIGDNLGTGSSAYVKLVRHGTAYLRSCSSPSQINSYDLSGSGASDVAGNAPPTTAQVEVGINAPNNGAGEPANTDLTWQPILTGPWTLTIPTDGTVSANDGLIVDGLTDITLVFTHYNNTVQ